MIAKRVHRKKATSDFGRLGRYMLEAKNEQAAILWARTADYILDTKHGGHKVAWSRITNCVSEAPGWAIAEIEATQNQNTRAKGDKTYHLVVSFPEGEKPSREQLEDIEDAICIGLGYGEHQRLSAVHLDTDNLHIHIAINKVHPQTLRCVEPYYDHYKLDGLCRQLEAKHGLQVDNRIEHNRMPGRQGDMEAHAGEASLLRWIKEQAGELLTKTLTDGQGWQDLHGTLAKFGLVIRPRGAGLVIATSDGQLAVKASSVDRQLGFKALTDRWGAYASPTEAIQAMPPERQYQKAPLHTHSEGRSLYDEFQKARETALQNRREGERQLRQTQEAYRQELKAWYAERYQALRKNTQLGGWAKREAVRKLSQKRTQDLNNQRQLEARQRQAMTRANPLPTWQGFLQSAAEQGDRRALAMLRSRQRRQQRQKQALAQAVLRTEVITEARHLVLAHLRPQARKNGDMVYRLNDGGHVADEAGQIRVEAVTAASTLLALTLAQERFANRPLVVDGTEDFRQMVATLAAKRGVTVRFADPALEQVRRQTGKAVFPSPGREGQGR